MESQEDIFGTICRVCLTPSAGNTESLIDKSKENGLSVHGEAVQRFADISIISITSTELVFPTRLCQNCLYLLKNAIKFKLLCEDSNKILEKLAYEKKTLQKTDIVDYCMFITYFPDNICDKQYERRTFANIDKNKEYSNQYASDNGEADENSKKYLIDLMEKCIPTEADTPHRKTLTRKENRQLKKQWKMQRLQEEKDKTYECEVCHKVLSSKRYYRNHMQSHEGYKVICEMCGRGFPAASQLSLHQARAHGAGRVLRCDHCGFTAARKYELSEHLRRHSGARPFACGCGARFSRRGVLRTHARAHLPPAVACPHCPRTFHRASEQRAHANSAHERAYMFACARCGRAFAKRASVHRHALARHAVPRGEARVLRIQLSGQNAANELTTRKVTESHPPPP